MNKTNFDNVEMFNPFEYSSFNEKTGRTQFSSRDFRKDVFSKSININILKNTAESLLEKCKNTQINLTSRICNISNKKQLDVFITLFNKALYHLESQYNLISSNSTFKADGNREQNYKTQIYIYTEVLPILTQVGVQLDNLGEIADALGNSTFHASTQKK